MAKFDCIADFEDLTPAEEKLIAACRAGRDCRIGEDRPTAATPENTIRATLLRVLIVGGTPNCGLSDRGVVLVGAWIAETLDLAFKSARGPTTLVSCVFVEEPYLPHAELSVLNLTNSQLPGFFALGLKVTGSLKLSEVYATKTVNLKNAQISGGIECIGALLDGGENSTIFQGVKASAGWNPALSAQDVEVDGSILFSYVKTLGTLDINSAKISGQVEFDHVKLDGKGDFALFGQNMSIVKGLVWRDIDATQVAGDVYLVGTHIGALVDDIASWPSELTLIGLTYERISTARISVQERLTWLARGSTVDEIFHPQPYTQLAKVLFAMGHDREAKKILI